MSDNSSQTLSSDRIQAQFLSKVVRGGPTFTLRNRVERAVWHAVWFILASWTPAQLHPWRRFLLRLFGAEMGNLTDVRGSARVWYPPNLIMKERALIAERVNCYNMAPIVLESDALVSQGAHLCAGSHDVDDASFQLIAKPIVIKANAWVAAEAFVGPGVTVGQGAVLGARAVSFKDLQPYTIYVGNPAKIQRARGQR